MTRGGFDATPAKASASRSDVSKMPHGVKPPIPPSTAYLSKILHFSFCIFAFAIPPSTPECILWLRPPRFHSLP